MASVKVCKLNKVMYSYNMQKYCTYLKMKCTNDGYVPFNICFQIQSSVIYIYNSTKYYQKFQ